ncbi:hypothetical protein [Kaistella sp.]
MKQFHETYKDFPKLSTLLIETKYSELEGKPRIENGSKNNYLRSVVMVA